jgi:hypothetical protein
MSDNEMDDIIRKVANEYHPPYNDMAWNKMEELLDKHLPVKKERSYRILYLLLALLIIGPATYFGITHFSGKTNHTQAIANNEQNKLSANQNKSDQDKLNSNSIQANDNKTANNNVANSNNVQTNSALNKTLPGSSIQNNTDISSITRSNSSTGTASTNKKTVNRKLSTKQSTKSKTKVTISHDDNDLATEPVNKSISTKDVTITDKKIKEEIVVNKPKEEIKTIKKDTLAIKDTSSKRSTVSKKNKKTGGFGNRLGISVSVGPDVSFVRAKDMGQMSPNYGAGLSYKLSNRLTVQSGFYVTNKIYNADSADYTPPKEFWNYYKTLDEVFANCKVYEIPVLLTYNFKTVKKHNWFATTGLSSFLMNTETYTYYYTNTTGDYTNKTYTLTNQNKHYFAVLTLSGGYRYNINKRFSLDASPYLKLPLAGIGYGKVKLNSAGALFSLTVKPFAK